MNERFRLNGLPFTCSNRAYETNIHCGKPHGPDQAAGSVFDKPLVVNDAKYSLWLEHVVEKVSGADTFWFMWYDANGSPTIPLSGVFDAEQIKDLIRQLAKFIAIS